MKDKLQTEESGLFDRVASIIEEARDRTVRAVNQNMVIAYWLIGREIVNEIQGGEDRAEYGKQVIEKLSEQLTKRYKKGFSAPTLWKFRQFYQCYSSHTEILSPLGTESKEDQKLSPQGIESEEKGRPTGDESQENLTIKDLRESFSPRLTWSHYRALMRVKNTDARRFYEQEAIEESWDKRELERNIQSQYYERIAKNQKLPARPKSSTQLTVSHQQSIDELKNPLVLEFLDLPDSPILHEKSLEAAIISKLQYFLLELGKGFAFVSRQKLLRYDDKDLFVDLVFYNCILKCYVLIDLKVGELNHSDVGQMDSYVRMYDELYTTPDDNPTIGLILCTEKNETVARYSVLKDRKQIFASKYMLYLPTEEELQLEIERERKLIEMQFEKETSNEEL
tara:strand:- start:443 stop:1627 length:1185 start_codon:yes stop_codon:yes gene_type:complete